VQPDLTNVEICHSSFCHILEKMGHDHVQSGPVKNLQLSKVIATHTCRYITVVISILHTNIYKVA